LSGLSFFWSSLLRSESPACLWRHPGQALRFIGGVVGNVTLAVSDRLLPGGRYECPVCGWRGWRFKTFLSPDEILPGCICPGCGSFDRHRLLVLGVRRELAGSGNQAPGVLLGCSLSPAMRTLLQGEGLDRCYRTDIAVGDPRFAPHFVSDLRAASVRNGRVDWIFCSHVLEHIDDLDGCLAEMARLLSPHGLAWIQVPLEPDLARSRRIEIDPERAHAHAWQFGRDFGDLLARPDWRVDEVTTGDLLDPDIARRHGIDPAERYWLIRNG